MNFLTWRMVLLIPGSESVDQFVPIYLAAVHCVFFKSIH